jgi:uncharacterized repeat protein (TIGR02543 family)
LRRTARGVALLVVFVAILATPGSWAAADNAPRSEGSRGQAAAAIPLFPNVRITDGSSPYAWQVEPTMVLNQSGTIYVGWKEASSNDGPGRRVGFSFSEDDGATWAPNFLMPQNHTGQGCANSDPWMALAPDDAVHYAYLEYECGSGIDFTSTRDGREWGPVHYIPSADPFGGLADKESLTVDSSGRLYAAWDEASLGNELQVTWSDDGGATWAPYVNPAGGGVLGVIVASSPDGTVYLTWWNFFSDDIVFDWSTDGGVTWHPDVRVNSVSGSASGGGWQIPLPAMNVDPASGVIYVAWPDSRNGNQDIYLASSDDGGQSWSENVRVNDDSSSTTQYMVDLAIDGDGTVHAAWEDKRSGDWDIYYANSTDGGQTWTQNFAVSEEPTPGSYTRPGDYFAIEAGRDDSINVVWTDGRGDDFDIYFARKHDTAAVSVTVTTDPLGIDVTVDGVTSRSPVSRIWPLGSAHTVGVSSPIPIAPGSRYLWLSWSDDGAMTHEVIADADLILTARFAKQHQVSVGAVPAGRTVLVDNVPITARTTYWWDDGLPHWLEAPPQLDDTSDIRYEWRSWSDGLARAHSVAPTAPLTLTATFVREETLHVTTSPEGLRFFVDDVEYSSSQAFWLEPGARPFVWVSESQSAPGARYTFLEWSDGGSVGHTVFFSRAMSLEARFRTEFYLTVTSPFGEASGGGWYDVGTIAFARLGSTSVPGATGVRTAFVGWTGHASGTGTVSSGIVMDGPKSATAAWRTEYFLQVASDVGTVDGTGWYPAGTSVEIRAPAELTHSGTTYRFAGWAGDASGTDPSVTIAMEGPRTVRATWQPTTGLLLLGSVTIGLGLVLVAFAVVVGFLVRRRGRRRS